jgi:hypothetical protein
MARISLETSEAVTREDPPHLAPKRVDKMIDALVRRKIKSQKRNIPEASS